MTQQDPGRDRLGRRAKRFLSPSQKYELWLQLVTGELSQGEAAEQFGLSNRAIAARLYVTERTVEAHVTQIFQKLHLPESPDQHRRVLAVLAFLRA
jgi:DNA-binding CsgD family transcriptional regulator